MGIEKFTFTSLESSLKQIQTLGFKFFTMKDYQLRPKEKVCYLRVDVDFDPGRVIEILNIVNRLNIPTTFFFRVFSPNYNPTSIACLELYRLIDNAGHEVGLHHDAIVASDILKISPIQAFWMQKKILELAIGKKILGSASHGSRYPMNNQDLFSHFSLEQLDLHYQAYDMEPGGLFFESRYVSDSEWTRWKAYDCGRLLDNDPRAPELHALDSNLLYVLVHPDTYYKVHSFESFTGAS